MACYLGHIYTKQKSTEVKIVLQCQNRSCIRNFFVGIMKVKNYRLLFSLAHCHTNLSMDTFLSEPTAHNHDPNPEHIPVIELSNWVKARSEYLMSQQAQFFTRRYEHFL